MEHKLPLAKKPSLLNLVFFLFLPFFSFLLSLRNLKSKSNTIVFILFCVLYGFAFSFQYTKADSFRMAQVFVSFDFKTLVDVYQVYILGGSPDVYKLGSYALIKNISSNPKVLFAFFGLVFGILWYFSIKIFLKEKRIPSDVYIYILFFVFLISNPITSINGARFNTAVWIFFIAVINIFLYSKKKYYFLLLIAPLVHFAFALPVLLTVFFYLFSRFFYNSNKINKLLYFLFVFTFLASWFLESNIIKLDFISDLIPSRSISNKISLYNSDDTSAVKEEKVSSSLFLQLSIYFNYITKAYFFAIIIYAYKWIKNLKQPDVLLIGFLAFLLLFYSVSFIAGSVPSGARFLHICYLLSLVLILKLYVANPSKTMKRFVVFSIPAYFFKIMSIVFFNYLLVSKTLWFGNVFWIIYEGIGFKLPAV